MNFIKSSWDIFAPNWLQKASVTCVTVHLEESLTQGGCGTARCAAPWKISLLGKAQNAQHSLCAALPPRLFVSKALCKRRVRKQQSISNVANTWWIIHSVMVQKGFPLFWLNNYLEGFSPSSALVVTGKLLWSQHVDAALASLLIWVGLGQSLRYTEVQPSPTVPVCSFVSDPCTFSSWPLQNKF